MIAEGVVLTGKQIMEALPHRFPMLLLDRVEGLVPGASAIGFKNVTNNEPFFQGHFPGEPIFPGVLLVECMAQLAGVVLRPSEAVTRSSGSGADLPYLLSVEKVKFRRLVVPGDTVVVEVSVLKKLGGMARVQATAKVRETVVASGELTVGNGRA
jgi:beta-hydroxyacyl-ACP dehydratase FabZ